jgi:SAM-dependent methyltransferase
MIKCCQACDGNSLKVLLDFGPQPVQNRFAKIPHSDDYYNPLTLVQCKNCSLIQLANPVPTNEIIPRIDWLKYNEREEHLDEVSDIVSSLRDLPEKPVACGITYKDDSLLRRLDEGSFGKIWRIDPEHDLGITQKGVVGETIIPKITTKTVKNMTDKYGYVDVVIARHILEHALDTKTFLSIIWDILKPGGYIVFEVPDCTKEMDNNDYTMPWEEHILYFVPETLKSFFSYTSFDLVQFQQFSFKTEDLQIAIVQKNENSTKKNLDLTLVKAPPKSFKKSEQYADSFLQYKKIIYSYLLKYSSNIGKIAIFGAGHRALMFIKAMEVEDFIDFIIDDSEHKQNLYLAGTSLQIKSSEFLMKDNISLCLFCLSVEHEDKIIKNNHKFLNEGGVFASTYSIQKNSLFQIASENFPI